MKKQIISTAFGLFLGSSAFASNLPYTVSYQDRGPILRHETCRLVVYNTGTSEKKYLNSELSEFLALKGYSVLDKVGMHYKNHLPAMENVNAGDLTLSMSTISEKRKHYHEGVLGYIEAKDSKEPISLREFDSFKSKTFKMGAGRGRTSVGNGQYYVSGQPFTISTKKGRRSLFDLYESLPECRTTGSGHSYEADIYNKDIPLNEFDSCLSLYNQEKRRLVKYKTSSMRNVVGYAGFTSIFVASAYPILWPVAGGIVGYHAVKGVRTKSLENQIDDSSKFFTAVKSCYEKQLRGEKCSKDKYVYPYGRLVVDYLSGKAKKKVSKYLEYMSFEELTQKIADYLGSTRACSVQASKARQITINKILNKAEKTF